jgi:4a-hydroxytetrahydrobiopterin dehydratase
MAAEDMSEWRPDGESLVRDLKFKDFAEAMGYVNRVADLAEEVNHHPTSSSTAGTRCV